MGNYCNRGMTIQQTAKWKKMIAEIKLYYPHFCIFYSSSEGWANISYKHRSYTIRYYMTAEAINEKLETILKAA